MARMPGATWLGEHSPRTPMARWDIYCVHTIVGYAPAHAAHFSVHAAGGIDQSRDTRYRSAANLNGNHRILASENEDHGGAFGPWDGSDVPPLTDAQVVSNGTILAWAHDVHGIPLKLCPNSRPRSRGLAYHRQGIDGNFGSYRFPGRVSGGEVWTEHYGKVCPGDARIAQLPDILDAALTLNRGGHLDGSDDMQLDDKISGHPKAVTVGQVLAEMHRFVEHSSQRERRMLRSLNGLPADVAELVLADLPKDLPGIEVPRLRRLVEAAARRAIDSRLGSLDEPDAP